MADEMTLRVQRFLSGFLCLVAAALLFVSGPPAHAATVLFIGNSFTYAANSPVHHFRHETVTDLNSKGVGGVPALFKSFTAEAGLDDSVSLETAGGVGLDWHFKNKAALIGKSWDIVVLQAYSTLNAARPGNPSLLIQSVKDMAALLRQNNPKVKIHLLATWTRADQTYLPTGHWYGQPVAAMEKDVRAGYDQAAAACPAVKDVIPVGQAWNRAISTGFADANPYDGIDAGKVDLWSFDNYHASMYGYYLDALTVFGDVTGLDPRSLGRGESCADELGISPDQAAAMQQIAYDELTAEAHLRLKPFTLHRIAGY
jgi:hypothetical protein